MREPTQESILAAYIAASGKRCPLDAANVASELCRLTRSLHPQATATSRELLASQKVTTVTKEKFHLLVLFPWRKPCSLSRIPR
jgi:hypothetical protein